MRTCFGLLRVLLLLSAASNISAVNTQARVA
eukprot:COSAG02_NODE_43776_length_371_cov_11.525735_1_plen_30_part_01